MKLSRFTLLPRPLLMGAALALLAGCTSTGQFDLFDPLKAFRERAADSTTANTSTWNGMPVGEMRVKSNTLLVLNAPLQSRAKVYEKYRTLLANEGVLYVLPRKMDGVCGNTQNQPALSVAYLEDDGAIGTIADMPANSSKQYCADRPIRRFLVMPYQWFTNNGIQSGDKVTDFAPVTDERREQIIAAWSQTPATQVAAAKPASAKSASAKPAPAKQVAAAKPATAPKSAKPAPKPVKDVGFLGNFEIGAGFGAQKASGIRGVVVGLNDGKNPNRLKAGRKVQTLDGKEYTLEFLGYTRRRDNCAFSVDKPQHRIKVTSPGNPPTKPRDSKVEFSH